VAVAILDQVEILDEQVAAARHVAQKLFDVFHSHGLDLAPFGDGSSNPAAGTGVACGSVIVRHGLVPQSRVAA
jgi:hypothetical protein